MAKHVVLLIFMESRLLFQPHPMRLGFTNPPGSANCRHHGMPTNIASRTKFNHWRTRHLGPRIRFLPTPHEMPWKGLPKTPSIAAKKPQVQTRQHRSNHSKQTMMPLQTCKARRANDRSCECEISHQRMDRFRNALRADQLNRRTSPEVENCRLHRFWLSHHPPWRRPGTTTTGNRSDKIPIP